ncbi:MAG TPA: hypothetical protein VFK94_06415 [Patescibacteria group bacterium]|nr:hypothetical protein [Patescibacteria group bacterium]
MPAVRLRSTRQREDFLEKDDLGNLYVTGGGSSGPTLVGVSSTGQATELQVAATVAAAANNQTLAGAAGKRTYITGFHVGGLGATAASVISVTITGISSTMTYRFSVPAGATAAAPFLDVEFTRPIPASADNTAIVVNVPSFGAGNTAADASARGFQI